MYDLALGAEGGTLGANSDGRFAANPGLALGGFARGLL